MNWRSIQLDRLANVEVIRNVRLDAAAVREYGAELVVVATGSSWALDGLNGVTHGPIAGALDFPDRVLSPEQVMTDGKRPPGRRVVVYDAEGYFVAAGIAELLALEGYEVEFVTCLDQVAPVCDETLEGPLLRRRLHERGIALRRAVTITCIEEERVLGVDEFDEPVEFETSGIVLVTQRRSDDALYHELAAEPALLEKWGIVGLYRIGDCVAPRIPADAIFDGHRLGREIDAAEPATPLLYRRERLAVGRMEP